MFIWLVTLQAFSWNSTSWQETRARKFCMDYIKDRYKVGKLCKRIQNVDFEQEITTCGEDIQVTRTCSCKL